jgi:ureidoacrylate peracid hydrolase
MADLTYEPELTGLLIVDPYNDFLSVGGKLYELSRETLETLNVVEHMKQVLGGPRTRHPGIHRAASSMARGRCA